MPTRFTMSVKLSKVEGKLQCVGLCGEDGAPQGGPMFLQIQLLHYSLLPNLAVIELRTKIDNLSVWHIMASIQGTHFKLQC